MKHIQSCRMLLWAAIALLCAGCASTYNPPREQKQELTESVNASKEKIYNVALHVLRRSGFRFAFADQEEGRITTRPKTMKLTDRQCDCGMGRGRSFASDERTTTDVSFFVIAREGNVSIRSVIEGQYVAADTSMVKRFHCVSRGLLEKDMLEKIKAGVAESEREPAPAVDQQEAE